MPLNNLIKIAFMFIFTAVFASSCVPFRKTSENPVKTNDNTANQTSNINRAIATNENADDAGARSADDKTTTGNAVAKAACMTVDMGKRAVTKSQTFAIDFEPFKGSCFVTTYNPEYGDIHMESQYDIYKSGKKVFSFPDQFNGSKFGCWVDGVAFKDMNHDGLTDVIVVGKCAAKSGDYNENMVYTNTGKAFTTNEDGNNQLGDFKTIKEISDFVEDNQQIFFK